MTTKKLSEMTDDELAAVADEVERAQWRETSVSNEWVEQNTTSVSLRMPNQLLEVLKAAAAAKGISYQTLMEKWLHERALVLAKENGRALSSEPEARPERRRRWMAEALAEYAASDVEKVWSSIDGEDFIEQ